MIDWKHICCTFGAAIDFMRSSGSEWMRIAQGGREKGKKGSGERKGEENEASIQD